jgi:predicted RNA-binding Zn-ribbon protein involved in translation (DUF1610 family)
VSAAKANCLICEAPLVYHEQAQEFTCALCGKTETGHSACENGHYVCDDCHRKKGTDFIMDFCERTDSKNPIEIAQEIMSDSSIYPNGPEHHTLVGAALLTAYANAGGDIDKRASLQELRNRSLSVPGGACGYWGVCGASVSSGQFWSIVIGATPLTSELWVEPQVLTSRISSRIASMGGPRCCKRTSFTAILESVAFAEEMRGVKMELPEKVVCKFFARNAECQREKCPYFPTGEK